MKTVRIQYTDKIESTADVSKTFTIADNREPISKVEGCYAHYIDDRTVDMLVPDNFDVSQLGGTIIKPDPANPLSVFMGHEKTMMVTDKAGTLEEPVRASEIIKI